MSDTESDEDLKRAIALSLNQPPPPVKQKTAVVDLISSSEDEDDDLDAPVAARKIKSSETLPYRNIEDQNAPTLNRAAKPSSDLPLSSEGATKPKETSLPQSGSSSQSRSTVSSSLLGLDRKKMEQERLLRAQQRKSLEDQRSTLAGEARKRKASTPPIQPTSLDTRHVKAKLSEAENELSDPSLSVDRNPILSFKDQAKALRAHGLQFPDGVVKKTWVYGCPRQDDIKIEEVLQKDDLELAVLSAFQIDPDWIATKLRPSTKVVFVLQAKTEAEVGVDFLLRCFHPFSSCSMLPTPHKEHQ